MTTDEFLTIVERLKILTVARLWHIRIYPDGDEPVIYTERAMERKYPLVIRFSFPLKEIQ